MRSWMTLVTIGFAVVGSVGCQNAMHDQNMALRKQNLELQDRLNAMESELGQRADSSQTDALQEGISARDARIADLQAQLANQPSAQPASMTAAPSIAGLETEYDAASGEMTVIVPGDVLFDSGVATLKPSAKTTLDRVVSALKSDYSDKTIRVEGHTDADPLVKTKKMWGDNRNLSLNRALAVTRYLEEKGIDAKRVVTSGFGEFEPRGADKAKNRRVDIVVVTR